MGLSLWHLLYPKFPPKYLTLLINRPILMINMGHLSHDESLDETY